MKQSILEKLQHLADRYEEVGALLSDPEVIGQQTRFRELSREYAELESVAGGFENSALIYSISESSKNGGKIKDENVKNVVVSFF